MGSDISLFKKGILSCRRSFGGVSRVPHDILKGLGIEALSEYLIEILELGDNELGGLKEGIANITGRTVFARHKYETGVHRVQRVIVTESQGRIHTSTVTGAVYSIPSHKSWLLRYLGQYRPIQWGFSQVILTGPIERHHSSLPPAPLYSPPWNSPFLCNSPFL
ncbi:Peptide chain release factor 1 [Entomobacter blattae]|uniref:Peptide chain release factor 1 n=1 Tax=Entomobacter blattae TaxID=2762277 RepID=A0A7H1NQS9_9PROT|nr:Peptide chain release factor 1 [Entomobacter blattae]